MNLLGPYNLVRLIARGGMGEVFIARDTSCGREIALKKIRPDLVNHPQIRRRFLKEAYLTCQLSHPGIIPIYSIHQEEKELYYTMPYVEGETLKHLLRKSHEALNLGTDNLQSFVRIFMAICQAVGYAHSKGILHRDLKPENIIVGKYGEVLILDWGLAKIMKTPDEVDENLSSLLALTETEMTQLGKIVGTISYMAPEIALGSPPSIQTDIYALGAILYQMLTLKNPFKRGKTIEEFKKKLSKEELIAPIVAAPYRDIPRLLSRIVEKCLDRDISKRYHSMDEVISDLSVYIEGKSDWFEAAQLEIGNKKDWELHESILIAEHMAITRATEEAEWANIMISKASFAGNLKIELDICLGEDSKGVGLMMSIPESHAHNRLEEGYCLWLASELEPTTRLMRAHVEVVQAPEIYLFRNRWYRIRMEKIDQTIQLSIDDKRQLSYISLIPMPGTHIGLLSKDADFKIRSFRVFVGSLSITESCLAVPDALLSRHLYNEAISEYRRVAASFSDRSEGRQAIFKTGLTLIEKAKRSAGKNKDPLLNEAMNEFEKLHQTPSAPLEYLGKSLIYQILEEYEDEIKCFEMAYRRYPKHPLLQILQEQVVARMHEMSRRQRKIAYQFILLAVQHLPLVSLDIHTRKLLNSLAKNWEKLSFIEEPTTIDNNYAHTQLAIQLAFRLEKPYVLEEITDEILKKPSPHSLEIMNVFWSLIYLGYWEQAEAKLYFIEDKLSLHDKEEIRQQLLRHKMNFDELTADICHCPPYEKVTFSQLRPLLYWMDRALDEKQTDFICTILKILENCELSFEQQLELNMRLIWALLIDKNWKEAGEVLYAYPLEFLNRESSPLFFLFGCWLSANKSKEMAFTHFSGVLAESYPRTWCAAAQCVQQRLDPAWHQRAFSWEVRQFERFVKLYQQTENG